MQPLLSLRICAQNVKGLYSNHTKKRSTDFITSLKALFDIFLLNETHVLDCSEIPSEWCGLRWIHSITSKEDSYGGVSLAYSLLLPDPINLSILFSTLPAAASASSDEDVKTRSLFIGFRLHSADFIFCSFYGISNTNTAAGMKRASKLLTNCHSLIPFAIELFYKSHPRIVNFPLIFIWGGDFNCSPTTTHSLSPHHPSFSLQRLLQPISTTGITPTSHVHLQLSVLPQLASLTTPCCTFTSSAGNPKHLDHFIISDPMNLITNSYFQQQHLDLDHQLIAISTTPVWSYVTPPTRSPYFKIPFHLANEPTFLLTVNRHVLHLITTSTSTTNWAHIFDKLVSWIHNYAKSFIAFDKKCTEKEIFSLKLQIASIPTTLLDDAIQSSILLDLHTQLSLLLLKPSSRLISQLGNLPSTVPDITPTKLIKPFIIPGIYDSTTHLYSTDVDTIQTNVFNHLSNHFTDHSIDAPPPPLYPAPYDFHNYNPPSISHKDRDVIDILPNAKLFLRSALDMHKQGKKHTTTSSCDLPLFFYTSPFTRRVFANLLAQLFTFTFNNMIFAKTLSSCLFIIVPKPGKSRCNIAAQRFIALHSIAHRLFVRVVLQKISLFIPYWIGTHQSGFVPKRSPDSNIYNQFLAAKEAIKDPNSSIAVLQIDEISAFDKVKHSHVRNTLIRAGLSIHMTDFIINLCGNISASILINGIISTPFLVTCGFLQGNALSSFLFIMATEAPLLCGIAYMNSQSRRHVPPLSLSSSLIAPAKVFADDTNIYIYSITQSQVWIKIFTLFTPISGISINYGKTGYTPLGNLSVNSSMGPSFKVYFPFTTIPNQKIAIYPCGSTIKNLGISMSIPNIFAANAVNILTDSTWASFVPSILRALRSAIFVSDIPFLRFQYINTTIMSRLTYRMMYTVIPPLLLTQIQSTYTSVLSGSLKLPLSTLQLSSNKGGIHLICLSTRQSALHITIVRKLINHFYTFNIHCALILQLALIISHKYSWCKIFTLSLDRLTTLPIPWLILNARDCVYSITQIQYSTYPYNDVLPTLLNALISLRNWNLLCSLPSTIPSICSIEKLFHYLNLLLNEPLLLNPYLFRNKQILTSPEIINFFTTNNLLQLRDVWNPTTFSFGFTTVHATFCLYKLANPTEILKLPLELSQLFVPTISLVDFDRIWLLLLAPPLSDLFSCLRNYFFQHQQEIVSVFPTYLKFNLDQIFTSTGTTFSLSRLHFNKCPHYISPSYIPFHKVSTSVLSSTMSLYSTRAVNLVGNRSSLPKGILKWREACPTLPLHFETNAWSIFSNYRGSSSFSKTTLFPLWIALHTVFTPVLFYPSESAYHHCLCTSCSGFPLCNASSVRNDTIHALWFCPIAKCFWKYVNKLLCLMNHHQLLLGINGILLLEHVLIVNNNPLLKPLYNIILIGLSTLKEFHNAVSLMALSTAYSSLPTFSQSVATIFSMFRLALHSFLIVELYKHRRSFFCISFKLHVVYHPFISLDVTVNDRKKPIINCLSRLNFLPEVPVHQSLLFQHYIKSASLLLNCFNSHSNASKNNAYLLYSNSNPVLQSSLTTVFRNDPLFFAIKYGIDSSFSTPDQKLFSFALLPLICLRSKIFDPAGIG
jgi:Reverse transcriptase (RNA-dependent DNA polymerase)